MTHLSVEIPFEEFPPLPVFFTQTDVAFLSGGLGSQLALHGTPPVTDGLPTIASLAAPDLLAKIHGEYANAGATVLTVDTFDLSPWRQIKHAVAGGIACPSAFGYERARLGILAAYEAGRKAQEAYPDRPLYLAGSVTSLEDCYDPNATPPNRVLAKEHFKNAALHAAAGADFLCIETIPSVREAVAAVRAAEACNLPFIVSFTVNEEGNPLDGNPIEAAEILTRSPLRIGIGANCCQIEGAENAVSKLAALFRATGREGQEHIVAYPNGYAHTREEFHAHNGSGVDKKHAQCCEVKKRVIPADEFALIAQGLRARGATLIGGCCGTSPAHTQAYVAALGGRLERRRLVA